ncbi:hypothetical protein [Amorphus orientalis]|uniref:Uncharacterized protein n=1 Tax=Amorphus orientalis TaxID=649198 RepID=A0AAE3VQQ4_9HYPH|nr:hypothetical protein [Amorphus orientalis]MDQ0316418.1 hypothetical protein [Amorphus orientalis]
MSDKPVKKFRIGYVEAAIWENEGNGDRTFHNVTLQRKYRDGDDVKNTNSFAHADLLNAARLLQKCEAWISDQ